jgi:site-specific recombinase XerD
MLPQCSHITRKRGVYYYRHRLPRHPTRELALSLRTRSFREAQWLAAMLDREFRKVMSSVKKYEKPEDIQRIAREYLKSKLEHDLEVRIASSHIGVYSRSKEPGRIVADDLEWIEGELLGARARLRERLYDHERHTIDGVMEYHAVPAEQRNALAHALYQADVEFWETVIERTKGNPYSEPPMLRSLEPLQLNGVPAPQPRTGSLLSEVLPSFLDYMASYEEWRGQTLAQNKTSYAMFKECCGDLPVTAYERRHLAAFYDLLRALPKLYSKCAAWRGLSLAEIAARTKEEEHERLSMTTVKRHFAALGRLFAYLKQRGEYQGENPAYGFEFPDKRRDREKRSMWQGEPLRKLFASPVWTGCLSEARRSKPGKLIIKDEKYWLPLLGIYHGNRLEEFAQLHRTDVGHEDGTWFLDVNDEGTKRVKNEQSKRRVPLHPELLRLGFLDYVEMTAPKPEDRLFPLLEPGGPDQKLGYYFTKWWSRYRKDVDVYEKGLDYHSFRASVATKLAENGVSLEVRNELLGHEGKSTDERNYQKGFSLKFLAEAIGTITWPELGL